MDGGSFQFIWKVLVSAIIQSDIKLFFRKIVIIHYTVKLHTIFSCMLSVTKVYGQPDSKDTIAKRHYNDGDDIEQCYAHLNRASSNVLLQLSGILSVSQFHLIITGFRANGIISIHSLSI